MSWWERHPGELEREILALQTEGWEPRKDEKAFAGGKAVIRLRLPVLGSERDAAITYPDLYPYFRPLFQVFGLNQALRHYNPFFGEACLLRRGTQHWYPETTAAEYIREMLPQWEKAAVRDFADARLDTEDTQAEPVSVYYPATRTQTAMVDSAWRVPPEVRSGRLRVALPEGDKSLTPSASFTAWVTAVEDDQKVPLQSTPVPAGLKGWIGGRKYKECIARWIRLDRPPFGRSEEELVTVLLSAGALKPVQNDLQHFRSGLFGFCFPEEGPDGEVRDGWLFLAYHADRNAIRKKVWPPRWIIRADYGGERDLFKRVPELSPLRGKTAVCVGLGCVGAPSAIAFARAGIGELRLLDGDVVSAGTICRWPLGLPSAGMGKVRELSNFIGENYPLTKLGTPHFPDRSASDFCMKIGHCDYGDDQWGVLDRLLDGADIVYDATAEQGVNLLLCDLARARNIPYVTVSSRAGGWGGNVVRVRAGESGGCYCCYLHALDDKSIPQPPYDPAGDDLQPTGCGEVTFKAAGFDVEEIALAGVRIAISTLCEGIPSGYPAMANDVGILTLRKEGEALFPQWEAFTLPKHPSCGRCSH